MRFENTSSSVKALASRCMQKSTAKFAFQKQPARYSKKEMPSCRLPAVFALGLGMHARLLVQHLQARCLHCICSPCLPGAQGTQVLPQEDGRATAWENAGMVPLLQASRGRDQPGETIADFGVRSFSSGPFRLHDGVSSRSDTPNVVGPQVDAVSALQFSNNPMAFLDDLDFITTRDRARECRDIVAGAVEQDYGAFSKIGKS